MLHYAHRSLIRRVSTWAPLVQNAVCVTASNCANSEKDFAVALAAYKIGDLVASVATAVMLKGIACRL